MAEDKNWSQVRNDTDSGKTDDKVDFPDPAAAPLGVDEEAGGERTPERDISRSEEQRGTELPPEHKGKPLITWAVIAVLALIIIFALVSL